MKIDRDVHDDPSIGIVVRRFLSTQIVRPVPRGRWRSGRCHEEGRCCGEGAGAAHASTRRKILIAVIRTVVFTQALTEVFDLLLTKLFKCPHSCDGTQVR